MTLTLLSTLLGCRGSCPPLDEVPADGGTDAEHAAVRSELERFERTLALPVCIDHVRFRSPRQDPKWAGRYNPATHGVRIASGLEPDTLRPVLLHEVCHGVDLQNDLVDGREDRFVYPDPPGDDDGHPEPREAFADTCAFGAASLAIVASAACPSDPDLRAATSIDDEVFLHDGPSFGASFRPVASIDLPTRYPGTLPEDLALWRVRFVEEAPGVLWVNMSGEDGAGRGWGWTVQVNAATGELVPDVPAVTAPDLVPGRTPDDWVVLDGGPVSEDRDIVRAVIDLPAGPVERLLARVGDDWLPVEDGCPSDTLSWFTVRGELWSGQADRLVVSWGQWAP